MGKRGRDRGEYRSEGVETEDTIKHHINSQFPHSYLPLSGTGSYLIYLLSKVNRVRQMRGTYIWYVMFVCIGGIDEADGKDDGEMETMFINAAAGRPDSFTCHWRINYSHQNYKLSSTS